MEGVNANLNWDYHHVMLGRLPNERLRPVRPAVDRINLDTGCRGRKPHNSPVSTSSNPCLASRERSGEGSRLTKDYTILVLTLGKMNPGKIEQPGACDYGRIINTQMLVRTMPCASSNELKIGIIITASYYRNQADLPRSLMPRFGHGKHLDIPQPAESNKPKRKQGERLMPFKNPSSLASSSIHSHTRGGVHY